MISNCEEAIRITEIHDQDNILQVLLLLGNSLFDQTVNKPDVLGNLAEKYSFHANVISLSINELIAGVCVYYDNDEKDHNAFVSMMVVEKSWQGKGYGTKLIRDVLERCKENHCRFLSLEVSRRNTVAQHFYEKEGFYLEQEKTDSLVYGIKLNRTNDRFD